MFAGEDFGADVVVEFWWKGVDLSDKVGHFCF